MKEFFFKRKLFFGAVIIVFFLVLASFQIVEQETYSIVNPVQKKLVTSFDFTSQYYPDNYIKIDLGDKKKIITVPVKIGDIVKEGQVIAQLDDTAQQKKYDQAESSFNSLASSRSSIASTQTNLVNSATTSKQQTQTTYNDLKDALEADITLASTTKEILLNSVDLLYGSTQNLSYQILMAVGTVDINSIIQSSINSSYDQMQTAQEEIEAQKIKAPFSGEIVYVSHDKYSASSAGANSSSFDFTSLLSGASSLNLSSLSSLSSLSGMSSGTTDPNSNYKTDVSFNPAEGNFIILTDKKTATMHVKASEIEILKIKKNMEVNVSFKATGQIVTSTVSNVYLFPEKKGAENPLYYFDVPLNNVTTTLPIGATVNGKVIISETPNALTLPLDAVLYDEAGVPFVFVNEADQKVKKTIELGNESDTEIVIKNGLDKNSSVIVDIKGKVNLLKLRPWLQNLLGIRK